MAIESSFIVKNASVDNVMLEINGDGQLTAGKGLLKDIAENTLNLNILQVQTNTELKNEDDVCEFYIDSNGLNNLVNTGETTSNYDSTNKEYTNQVIVGELEDYEGSNNGIINGATSLTGKLSNGLGFDGNDYVSLSNYIPAFNTNNWTFALWMNMDNVAEINQIFEQYEGNGVMLETDDDAGNGYGKPRIYITNGSNYTFIRTDIDIRGSWHHVVFLRDGNTLKIYINGSLAGSDTYNYLPTYNGAGEIGAGYWSSSRSRYFKGKMDEIGIWSRALTQSEISQIYNSGSGLVRTNFSTELQINLQHYYNCENNYYEREIVHDINKTISNIYLRALDKNGKETDVGTYKYKLYNGTSYSQELEPNVLNTNSLSGTITKIVIIQKDNEASKINRFVGLIN